MQENNDPAVDSKTGLDRNFWILISGSMVSMFGDQFTLIALPWLVLKLTGSAVALGTVLAVMAIPRAALMLLGGAIVDRFSPRKVLIISRSVNALVIALLAALVWAGDIRLWLLYLLALGIGTATAFAYPAGASILPQVVAPTRLEAANGITMSLRQLSMFVGPALAGVVIAIFGNSAGVHDVAGKIPDASGIATAFTIDAVSFLASIGSLLIIRLRISTVSKAGQQMRSVIHSIGEGLTAVWKDFPLRAFMLYISAVSIFVGGPLQVGLPVLANQRLDWGAASYGALMSANGAGVLVGSLIASLGGLRRIAVRLGLTVLIVDSIMGLVLAAMGFVHHTSIGIAMLLVSGSIGGFIQIAMMSWIQRRVAPEMMGRTMSLLMFTFLGLAPLSAALGGLVLAHTSVTVLFCGAGLLLSTIALLSLFNSSMRTISSNASMAVNPPS